MVVDTCAHAAQTHRHVFHGFKLLHGRAHPSVGWHTVDHDPVHRRAPAPMGGLFHQQHPCPGATCSQRRLQPGNPAADDQQITEDIEMLVAIPVAFLGRFAQTGGLADERLKEVFPRVARGHERLVVKARGQEPADQPVQRTHIRLKARPVVLAFRLQPCKQLRRGGALVGLKKRALAQIDQRVGLLRAAGDDAARTVILEGSPHKHLICPKKCGGQRIPRIALLAEAVEGKLHRARSVDQPSTVFQAKAHCAISQLGRFARIASTISDGGSVVCAG